MPDKVYTQNVEFRISDELYAEVCELTEQHRLTKQEFAIASVGLLNGTVGKLFQTNETLLIVNEIDKYPLPSLVRDENHWPNKFSVALKPELHDPLVNYVHGRKIDIHERARRALRFGVFVLTHTAPYEDEDVLFEHGGRTVGIPFRTQ